MEIDDALYIDSDGNERCIEEDAVAFLLASGGIVFISSLKYVTNCGTYGTTSGLAVNCNDLFEWGTSDCEDLPYGEIANLYKMVKNDSRYGSSKWACMRRNLRPQSPVEKKMREDGAWDSDMESLPKNR